MRSLTYESSGSKVIKLSYVSRKTCSFEIIFLKNSVSNTGMPKCQELVKIDQPFICPRDFRRILDIVLSEGKSAIPPLFYANEKLPSASEKAKFFAEIFSKNPYHF